MCEECRVPAFPLACCSQNGCHLEVDVPPNPPLGLLHRPIKQRPLLIHRLQRHLNRFPQPLFLPRHLRPQRIRMYRKPSVIRPLRLLAHPAHTLHSNRISLRPHAQIIDNKPILLRQQVLVRKRNTRSCKLGAVLALHVQQRETTGQDSDAEG